MKDSKNLVIGMLCAVVCIMAVAYAAFSTTLTINGTATIASNWCVRIKDNPSCTTAATTGAAASSVTASATKDSDTLATINMSFTQPGDSATCTVTYENCGTLDASLSHVVTGADGTSAIKFTVTGTTGTTTLAKGGTHIVTVKGEYLSSITSEPEESAKTATVKIVSTATQAGV